MPGVVSSPAPPPAPSQRLGGVGGMRNGLCFQLGWGQTPGGPAQRPSMLLEFIFLEMLKGFREAVFGTEGEKRQRKH